MKSNIQINKTSGKHIKENEKYKVMRISNELTTIEKQELLTAEAKLSVLEAISDFKSGNMLITTINKLIEIQFIENRMVSANAAFYLLCAVQDIFLEMAEKCPHEKQQSIQMFKDSVEDIDEILCNLDSLVFEHIGY